MSLPAVWGACLRVLIESPVSIRPRSVRLSLGSLATGADRGGPRGARPGGGGELRVLIGQAVSISPGGAGPPGLPEPKLVTLPARGRS